MPDNARDDASNEISEWTRDTFDKAVRELIGRGIMEGAVVEARPLWNIPNSIVIGRARMSSDPATSFWIIADDGIADYAGSAIGATPRAAARHFSLKWQMDAARIDDTEVADRLATRAEDLYELVEADGLW